MIGAVVVFDADPHLEHTSLHQGSEPASLEVGRKRCLETVSKLRKREVELAVGELERAPRGFKLGKAVRVPRHLNFNFNYLLNCLVDIHNGWFCHLGVTTRAITSADTALVQHIAVAIAGARGDPTSVAHAAEVYDLAAICHAVASRATRAITSAHTACIYYISSAVALAHEDARSTAHLCVCVCQRERKRESER